jgi:hypothetical protein
MTRRRALVDTSAWIETLPAMEIQMSARRCGPQPKRAEPCFAIWSSWNCGTEPRALTSIESFEISS